MYLPAHFRQDDPQELRRFMREHGFALLVTAPEGVPYASHLPLLVHEEQGEVYLRSHMARANRQWQHFGDSEVLVVFQGPHALVHANWYDSAPNVPTWNYAAVHAYGAARVVEGEATREIAYGLVRQHTPDMHDIPEDFERRLLAGVVTFEVRVTRLEGKYKLSQNKSAQDRSNVVAALALSERASDRDTARLMQRALEQETCLEGTP
ncbi:FMN-binding negative transcriptional regulator [Deinococcus peraridilitoris]|uniref:Transcriptional regulator n=1 Tax=Deinococcus peraridilitoris (strain DSM 19664 / LMG 22246 / CIP 109416 / KR-200) TaxID=937777 RepID=L0A3J0_DEIPD|nr:FMN-binding negative transcriptional regulator [Deinococcus peraridilitoris]AFZ67742.1 transcriptional regulator [Deinococcus peraridilitoris DSM 19664]